MSITPKDITEIFWTEGLNHFVGKSSIGLMMIDKSNNELIVMNMCGTRVIKGKSVKLLKELANHYHKTNLFDSYKMFVRNA